MFLFGLVALVVVDYVQLIVPKLYKYVINGISKGVVEFEGQILKFDMNFLLDHICRPLLVIIVAMIICRFLWRICFFGAAIKVETDLRSKMFSHCKDLSPQYYQVNKVGNLMSLFTNDLDTINECFGDGVLMFCDALFLGVLAIWRMAELNPTLTLFSLIPMIFLFITATIVGKTMMKKWKKRQEAFSRLSDFSQEVFSGLSVIKAFVKEVIELMEFKKLNKENEDINVSFTKTATLMRISVALFVESVVCVILGYGGYVVKQGGLDSGELLEFIGYFNSIIWPIMAVSQLIEMSARGKASLNRVSELLDAPIDVKDSSTVHQVDSIKGEVEFRNLSFRYPDGDYDILKNVSLKINAGESVGIIGRTGSGKTTIVDLILRTYNIPENSLFIDGHDITSIPIYTVRKYAAYVPQDNFLFSDTIANNIALATEHGGMDEIKLAAKMADIDGNIMDFKSGYQTVLGERGVTVSGGQKQRISIARALMKNAPILILDDSVSAVDVKTEKIILNNLRAIRKGMTTILIAHRISTVEDMDKIVFIDNGRIVAVGDHNTLYNNCIEYRNMVELQRLDDEQEGV
ncbi:MAG: ABC transporter ATP-binding protein [Clostridia bacterium]|nr:ABC transporter ATP-binding protein [Clostridia bacterium]